MNGLFLCSNISKVSFRFKRVYNMETILIMQIMASFYGLSAVIMGAFGAHVLKKHFNEGQLRSFETAVKYQMYHALLLLILSFNLGFTQKLEVYMAHFLIWGTFLFSFSIYGLILSGLKGRKWKFLGPITPLGGLFLVIGWVLLLFSVLGNFI